MAFAAPRLCSLLSREAAGPVLHAQPAWSWQATAAAKFSRARRSISTEIGEDKTGIIRAGKNEGIVFIDNIFPLRLQWLMRIPFLNVESSLPQMLARVKGDRANMIDPMRLVQQALPKELPINITQIIPRVKEGGVFVKFTHDPVIELRELEGTVHNYLKENPVHPLFSPWTRVRSFLVRGTPWLEDLQRFPSQKIRVDFIGVDGTEGKEVPQEILYGLFRRFGKLHEIKPMPSDSKTVPRYATLYYRRARRAVMARNCMHGYVIPQTIADGKFAGTMLKLSYEPMLKAHWVRDWMKDHPRVVLPILVALAAGISIAIFDPVRSFFVKAHVERSFHIDDNKIYQWLVRRIRSVNIFSKHSEEGLRTIWNDRKANIEQIQAWLLESTDTFIVVQGPRGAGKKELVVGEALKDRPMKLVIDCKPIQEARTDSNTINAAANEVGYRPVFSWMNSISSLLDLAAQGTIGTKTGFSETLDTQLGKIWSTTAVALKSVALRDRSKDPKDKNLGDDEYLEAHPEKRPVVIIDNFLHKSQENTVVYDKVAEWAANLTTSNIAHVIFLTTDVSFSKSLSNALPDRVFRTITLGDCSPAVAKKFVLDHIKSNSEAAAGEGGDAKVSEIQARPDLNELDGCIATLGGRLTDLEFLARRITSGDSPQRAVQEIIEQSASEILKMYILDVDRTSTGSSSSSSSGRTWSATQAWYLVKLLANNDQIRYNETLLSDSFKSAEHVLRALEQAEMISITSANGRPVSIKPGKPVYRAAFQYLTQDRVLKARLDLAGLSEAIKGATSDIDGYERELTTLAALPKQPREITPRVRYLLEKLQASQAKIEACEKEQGLLKKLLSEQY